MGLNVRGIATSIKTDNISELTNLLGLDTPTKIDTTYFENATSSRIEDNEIFLTVTSNGTVLTVGDEIAIEEISLDKLSKNGKALKFMVGETAMVFGFDYYENGKLLRSVINAEGENVHAEGEPLDIEEGEDDCTELICSIMDSVSGGSIYSIEPDVEAVRYKFLKGDNKPSNEITQNPPIIETISETTESKPWWKFW